MASHKISIQSFDDTVFEFIVASSAGKGSSKKLIGCTDVADNSVYYKVYDHGNCVIQTNNFNEAVKFYNEAK